MVRTEGLRAAEALDVDGGIVSRVSERVKRVMCALHGHDNLLQFEHERMYLRCVSCGHESTGWALTEAPPTVTVRGDARRQAIVRPKLVTARRVA